MMEKLGFVVFILCLLSLLMACGAIVWTALNFHRLMKVFSIAAVEFQAINNNEPSIQDQLVEYAAISDLVRMKILHDDAGYAAWQKLPQQVRNDIERRVQSLQPMKVMS